MRLKPLLARLSCPDAVVNRLDALQEDAVARQAIQHLSEQQLQMLLSILDLSDFLFRFLRRHPEALPLLGSYPGPCPKVGRLSELPAMRYWKYCCLLQISALDLGAVCSYPRLFGLLSAVADEITLRAHGVAAAHVADSTGVAVGERLASVALGKLGARELNYSSDIDLIFVCDEGATAVRQACQEHVRRFSSMLEERTEDGFFYRVDLNLRPWGRSAPLVLDIDATERYYEGSKESWERLAWLRARPLTGIPALAEDILGRLQPFVYHRALGLEDVRRFLQIKEAMAKQRQRAGEWNIKTGPGGIRDIEFFVQLLQVLNGARQPDLRVAGTLGAMDGLRRHGLIEAGEYRSLREAYLFLRKLEHRVQMVDEQQTHALPSGRAKQLQIACAMGYARAEPEAQLEQFQEELSSHQQLARQFFDGLLKADS